MTHHYGNNLVAAQKLVVNWSVSGSVDLYGVPLFKNEQRGKIRLLVKPRPRSDQIFDKIVILAILEPIFLYICLFIEDIVLDGIPNRNSTLIISDMELFEANFVHT